MSDIDILHEMIRNVAKVQVIDNGYGKMQAILTEPQCPDSCVTLSGMPNTEDFIIIKADVFQSPDTLFCGSKGECKRADFIIVADTGKKKVIVFIEMKAKKGQRNEIIEQLTGAKCLIAYFREIGKNFWNQQNFLDDYVYRFVSIGKTRLPKKKTRISRSSKIHDSPAKMLKISSPHHLYFNDLVGNVAGKK